MRKKKERANNSYRIEPLEPRLMMDAILSIKKKPKPRLKNQQEKFARDDCKIGILQQRKICIDTPTEADMKAFKKDIPVGSTSLSR